MREHGKCASHAVLACEQLDALSMAQALLDIAVHVQPARLLRHHRGAQLAAKKSCVTHREALRCVATARVLLRGRAD